MNILTATSFALGHRFVVSAVGRRFPGGTHRPTLAAQAPLRRRRSAARAEALAQRESALLLVNLGSRRAGATAWSLALGGTAPGLVGAGERCASPAPCGHR